jgi:peptide subunit release factor 1 (eRF1)
VLHEIDLRALAALRGPERAFVSLYARWPEGLKPFAARERQLRALLAGQPDEAEHFERGLALARATLEASPPPDGPFALFACWAIDFARAFPLPPDVAAPRLLRADASPYIRPLAELQDEYENFLIVAADNGATRILHVTDAVAGAGERVKGDVKNAVKVGGWSQQRYARRRDKQLHHYAKEVADVLDDLCRRGPFARVVLLGSRETLAELEGVLSPVVAEKVAAAAPADLKADDRTLVERAYALYFEEERESEARLWDRVRSELLGGGLAASGAADVLAATLVGRADALLIARDAKLPGTRCRACENVAAGESGACEVCGSASVFPVDLVDELARAAELTSARVEFADPIEGLSELGGVAALLRY